MNFILEQKSCFYYLQWFVKVAFSKHWQTNKLSITQGSEHFFTVKLTEVKEIKCSEAILTHSQWPGQGHVLIW